MKVLAINTYAGSLLLGTKLAGMELVGSYEDSGFGADIVAANFPGLPQIRNVKDWPAQDLLGTIVIAHPPCSAFSTMNSNPKAAATRGTASDAFDCTKKVLRYGMMNNASAIAVESVPGAYRGAAAVHEDYARRYGYHLYRVLQNAITFGVPQWRPRFWAIFVKQGLTNPDMWFGLRPVFRSLRETLTDDRGAGIEMLDRWWEEQKAYLQGGERRIRQHTDNPNTIKLRESHQLKGKKLEQLLNGELGYGPIPKVVAGYLKTDVSPQKFDRNRGAFTGQWMHVWDPGQYVGTVMGSSWWAAKGRVLGEDDYKRIMGFPATYVFPNGTLRKNMRMYLSKGVVPQVAAWVLTMIEHHLKKQPVLLPNLQMVEPGGTADYTIRKKDWRNDDVQFGNR